MSKSATEIAKSIMYDHDAFSQLLGMEITAVGLQTATVRMAVTAEMTNGFGIAHGGITYSLADSTFAFACNSEGTQAVSVETSISHVAKVSAGDVLTATASLISRSRKIGRYQVKVHNQEEKLVADFKGTCYYTSVEY